MNADVTVKQNKGLPKRTCWSGFCYDSCKFPARRNEASCDPESSSEDTNQLLTGTETGSVEL